MKLDVKYILCAKEELLKCEKLGYTKKEGVTVPWEANNDRFHI